MGSYTVKTTAVMLVVDAFFNVALAICFILVFGIEEADRGAFWKLWWLLYLPRTAIWIGIRVILVRPLDKWLSREKGSYDRELARLAAGAIYNFPLVYTVFYACLFLAFYLVLTLVLVFGSQPVQLGSAALIPGILFAFAVGFGGLAVGFPLNLFLFGPVAGKISLPAREHGDQLPGMWLSIQTKIIMLSLCLALTPSLVLFGTHAMVDLSSRASEAQRLGALVADEVARNPASYDFWEQQPGVLLQRSGEPPSPSLQVKIRETPGLEEALQQAGRHPRLSLAVHRSAELVVVVPYRRAEGWLGLVWTALLATVFSALCAWLMGRSVADPVARIADIVDNIVKKGEVEGQERSPVFFKDEVGQLAEGTNEMIERLASSRQALQNTLDDLATKNRELETAYRIKGEFLANMSHELRTPLNAIIGFSKLMLRKTKDTLPARQLKNLNLIHQSGQNLLALVNDLLDFERIEAGRLTVSPQEVDMQEMAAQIQEMLEPMAQAKQMTLAVECHERPLLLFTDPDRLRQILVNLTTNAIKYSDEGHVQVDFEVAEKEIRLSVTDQGLGIPEDQLEHIFDPFHQVDASATREREGAGLGLAIVSKLATLMGGRMEVESRVGQGSTFRFVLPDTKLIAESLGNVAALEPAGAGPEVLVIDDQPSFLEVIYSELTEAGYRVHLAASGEEGLEKLERLKPRAVLLDIVMPGMGGWEVLKAIRGNPETAQLPVVITSVLDDAPIGYELGIAAWLTKPVDVAQFDEILGLRKLEGAVMVVEDDASTRGLLAQELESLGLELVFCATVAEARRQLEKSTPGALILDLGLPDGDGFDVLETLSQVTSEGAVPVVVYTARDLTEEELQRLAEGVVEVVKKHGKDSLSEVLRALPI